MEAKEKASSLVQNITDLIFDTGCTVSKPMVKLVANFCVDEIIKTLKFSDEFLSINSYYLNESFVNDETYLEYLQSVKAHIEEL